MLNKRPQLITIPVSNDSKPIESAFTLSGSEEVIVTSFKPSKDKEAWLIRLFNSSDQAEDVTINWGTKKPSTINLSSPLEEKGELASNKFNLVPWEILTIRAEIK